METYRYDEVMEKLFLTFIGDTQINLCRRPLYSSLSENIILGDIKGLRHELSKINENLFENQEGFDAYEFKHRYQVGSLLKRYIHKNDVYTVDDLIGKSCEKFTSNQDRLSNLSIDLPKRYWLVVKEARRYCAKVLGQYNSAEHAALCSFGSRATVGVPLSQACEAARWETPITGSKEEISWFCDYVADDFAAMSYLLRRNTGENPMFREVTHLDLSLVPKKFDSLRSITPNTTIGSFRSAGLGRMMSAGLRREGYDISTLQNVHGRLARQGSISGDLVTCDQTMASDNVTVLLGHTLLPGEWMKQILLGRLGRIQLPDKTISATSTLGLMGIGYTFPLQTLIFLSLLKGIESVFFKHNPGIISAYGDDLIYHKSLHPYVAELFPMLGLQISEGKTFVSGRFRESCGSDFFAGVDVRPFSPKSENGSETGKKNTFLAFLHKIINGMIRRWSIEEIPLTLNMLLQEVVKFGPVLQAPADYPDESGVKYDLRSLCGTLNIPVAQRRHIGHGVFRFRSLRVKPQRRKELRHEPYMWRVLSGLTSNSNTYDNSLSHRCSASPTLQRVDRICAADERPPIFNWIEESSGSQKAKTGQCKKEPYVAIFSPTVSYERVPGKSTFTPVSS